jgi:hypothetical protein
MKDSGTSKHGPWRRCSSCAGVCYWHIDAWVCDACGDEWYPDHGDPFAAPMPVARCEPCGWTGPPAATETQASESYDLHASGRTHRLRMGEDRRDQVRVGS